jgi:hypothetical protein
VQAQSRVKASPTGTTVVGLIEEEANVRQPRSPLTRAERLQLAAAVLRGLLDGAARAVVTWLLESHIYR